MVCNKVLLHLHNCFSFSLLFQVVKYVKIHAWLQYSTFYSDSDVTFHIITLTELQQKWFIGVL